MKILVANIGSTSFKYRLLEMPEGGLPDFLNWWLVLRAALDGRRIHARGDVTFEGETRRSFTPDDSDEAMRAFLEEAGYLHIRGLFSEEEMAAVAADYDVAVRYAEWEAMTLFEGRALGALGFAVFEPLDHEVGLGDGARGALADLGEHRPGAVEGPAPAAHDSG